VSQTAGPTGMECRLPDALARRPPPSPPSHTHIALFSVASLTRRQQALKPSIVDFFDVMRISSRLLRIVVCVSDMASVTDASGAYRPDVYCVSPNGFSKEASQTPVSLALPLHREGREFTCGPLVFLCVSGVQGCCCA
jgi:hypothetical protein